MLVSEVAMTRYFRTRLFSFALPILLADAAPRCGPRPERPVPPPSPSPADTTQTSGDAAP